MKRVNRVEESAKVQERINALEAMMEDRWSEESHAPIIEEILKEYIARLG